MSRHTPTQFVTAIAVALALFASPEIARAQIAGESVNMVTGTDPIGGDPYLQRQNEPSIAVSSANPEHLLAGANDYRTVDIAKAPADKMAGDAWAGIFKSLDGGKTWKSYLMPGYPQDPARYDAAGAQLSRTSPKAPTLMWCGNATAAVAATATTAAVPATDGTCTSAADPVVRSGADGMIYFGGIVFQRFTNNGKVYLARFIDLNNKENGDPTMGTDPIRFVDQKVVALGGPTDFVDKPWVAVDVPRATNPACSVNVNTRDPVTGKVTTTNRTFPGHTVYVAYLRFYNNETQSDVMIRHSDDCGATWAAPVKVSDATSLANEGPSLAIDPVKGHVYVTWRRVQITNAAGAILQTNSIMLSRSFSRATKFTKPREVAAVALPFDQNKDIVKAAYSAADPQGTWKHSVFRVTLFPSAAISVDKAGARRLHVAWSERGGGAVSTDARVVVATKLLSAPPITEREEDETDATCQKLDRPKPVDGKPILVDSKPLDAQLGLTFERGHQFMPSLTFSQGRLMLVYYDSRLDHSRSLYKPRPANAADPTQPDAAGAFYDVVRAPIAASNTKGADQFTDLIQNVFIPFIDDGLVAYVRHTLDVRVAQADPADAPAFAAAALSKFPFGTRGDEGFLMDANGDLLVPAYPNGVDPDPSGAVAIVKGKQPQLLQQLKVNPPNLPMFKGGTTPFLGDYIDVQGPAFVKKAGKWVFNNDWVASPVFHAVWTSNEDVRAPLDDNWEKYTPVFVPPGSNGYSKQDPTQKLDACVAGTPAVQYTGTRNQNIYTSRITDGLVVTTPQNAKPLDATQIRSFVVAAANTTSKLKTVKYTFSATGVSASFRIKPNGQLDALTTVTADIAPHSSVSRTLFARSTNPSATITVTVTEQGGAAATGFVLLNPPGSVPGLVAPDGAGSIADPAGESYKAIQIAANLSNANLSNANLSNANLSNANLSNANLSNANLSNANLSNANLSNAALANLSNANLSNANLSNANLSNANLSNANLSNANLSNANLSNANLSNSAVSDLNYEYQNNGNTTASYTIKLVGTQPDALAGEKLHLIVAKTYTTPTAVGCSLKEEAHNHILASIPDVGPYVVDPTTPVDPSVGATAAQYATLVLAPGEKAQITLRGNVALARMAEIGATVTPAPIPQQTPVGGLGGTTTYKQFVGKTSTTTAPTYDGAGLLSATVTYQASPGGTPIPVTAGSVSFVSSGNVYLGTAPLDSTTGMAALHTSDLVTGSTVTAFYSGSTTYLASQGTTPTTAIQVEVRPATKTLAPGGTWGFNATVTGTGTAVTNVTWSVTEANGGTFTLDGPNYASYTAPATEGTYHLVARSVLDRTKIFTVTITVAASAGLLTVSPPTPSLVVGQAQTFTAAINGATLLAVDWSVSPVNGATITPAGSFVATLPGTYVVTASSMANASLFGAATVAVSATVPGAPTGVTAQAGTQNVLLSWTAPASDGGSPIAGYIVTFTPASGSPGTITLNGSGTSTTVVNLTGGIAYTFTVAAFNAAGAGTGPASTSVTVTPATPINPPSAPMSWSALTGDGNALLRWSVPLSDGGSPITGYVLTLTPAGGSIGINGASASITGLTNGVAYTAAVAATNAAGTGPATFIGPFTPAGVPAAPGGVTATAGDASVTLTWTEPASNGSAITGYSVRVTPASGSIAIVGTTATITGLANDTSYAFTVSASNNAGAGPQSSPVTATPVAPVGGGTFNVSGAINDGYVVIRVYKNTFAFPGATVTLTSGGVTVPIPSIGGTDYSTNSYVLPPSGQLVTLTVTDGVNKAEGAVAVPSRPTITSPTAGATIPAGSPLTVNWTIAPATSPARFALEGCWPAPCGGSPWATLPGSALTYTIPANYFPVGPSVSMVLSAVNDLLVGGASTLGSSVWVNASSPVAGYLNFKAAASAMNGLVVPRVGHTSVALGGKVYSIGGVTGTAPFTYLSSVERYDPATGQSIMVAPMSVPRHVAGAAVANGKIYVFGGNPGNGTYWDTTEVYDPATDAWTARAPMPAKRSHLRGVYVPLRGLIYAVGGFGQPATEDGRIDAYDPVADTWAAKGVMTSPRAGFALAESGGMLYAIGGYSTDTGGATLTTVETIETSAGWTSVGPGGATPIGSGTATITMADDNILTVAGSTQNDLVETFVPYSPQAWALPSPAWTAANPVGVQYPGLATTDGHTVVVTGGWAWGTSNPVATITSFVAPITVAVGPTGATIASAQTQAFYARVAGTSDTAVTWSVTPGAGTIDPSGLFTPSGATGTFTVTATSLADSTAVGSATITVTRPPASWAVLPATMPTPRYGHALGVVGANIYAWGGSANLNGGGVVGPTNALDVFYSTWGPLGQWNSWSSSIGTAVDRAAPLQVGTSLYLIGGLPPNAASVNDALNTWQGFDMVSYTYTVPTALPAVARHSAGAGYVNGRFMITGGDGPTGFFLDSTETWTGNPADAWTPAAPMTTGRSRHGVAVVGTRLFAIGGQAPYVMATASVEIYDALSNSWTAGPDLPTPTIDPATAVLDGKIYVFGYDPYSYARFTYVLDTTAQTPTWSSLPSPPVPIASGRAVAANGKIYVVGGDGTTLWDGHVQVLTP